MRAGPGKLSTLVRALLDIEKDSQNKFLPNGPRDLVREFVSNLDSQMLARINKLKLGKNANKNKNIYSGQNTYRII